LTEGAPGLKELQEEVDSLMVMSLASILVALEMRGLKTTWQRETMAMSSILTGSRDQMLKRRGAASSITLL